jgi:hypothetical protein
MVAESVGFTRGMLVKTFGGNSGTPAWIDGSASMLLKGSNRLRMAILDHEKIFLMQAVDWLSISAGNNHIDDDGSRICMEDDRSVRAGCRGLALRQSGVEDSYIHKDKHRRQGTVRGLKHRNLLMLRQQVRSASPDLSNKAQLVNSGKLWFGCRAASNVESLSTQR